MDKNIDVNVNVPPSVDTAVGNLTNKPTASLGNGISNFIDMIFAPFNYLSEKQKIKYDSKIKQFKEEIDEKMLRIPQKDLKDPNMQITGVALENSKYCLDSEELRNMFANLITKSMDINYSAITHPSFAEIIKQMSPLDAQNLVLFQGSNLPLAEYRINIVDKNNKQTSGYQTIFTNVFLANKNEKDLHLQAESLSNLERLGLIRISYNEWIADERIYDDFLKTIEFNRVKSKGHDISIQKGLAMVTPLGENFKKVCLP